MKKLIATSVNFKCAGKIYDFLSNRIEVKTGDVVVIESEKGVDMATVVYPPREISLPREQEMKRVVRLATEEDFRQKAKNAADCIEAVKVCRDLVKEHDLQLKLLLAEYTLDRSKMTFYYTADNRIDFRQLVKDLAKVYRTRIEMRQIGVRDATKILGGFGICGRELCCTSFLRKFDNISIKTAKDQNIPSTASKISGICGRLMCCLVYERSDCDKCGGARIAVDYEDTGDVMAEIVVAEKTEGEL